MENKATLNIAGAQSAPIKKGLKKYYNGLKYATTTMGRFLQSGKDSTLMLQK